MRPCHFLGVCMKALAPALRLHTSPLPGGPGAWVICCFFKLAPHPWTVCQEGPLFMRISCWLQLTLRCTILGLCPELFLFFLEAPPPPNCSLLSLNPTSPSLILWSEKPREAGGGHGSEALQRTLVSRAPWRGGREALSSGGEGCQVTSAGGWGRGTCWGSEWGWGWGGNKREAGE